MANKLHENSSFQHILSVTEEIILEKGCRNTTLKDIIEKSGLSKGAIYHYVNSKDELFSVILQSKIEAMNQEFNNKVSRLIQEGSSNSTGQFNLVSQFFNSHQGKNDVGNLIFIYLVSQENEEVKKLLHKIFEKSKETGTNWIKIGQQYGVIPASIHAEKIALLLMTFSYGLRVTQLLTDDAEDKVEAHDIFNLVMKSLQ